MTRGLFSNTLRDRAAGEAPTDTCGSQGPLVSVFAPTLALPVPLHWRHLPVCQPSSRASPGAGLLNPMGHSAQEQSLAAK